MSHGTIGRRAAVRATAVGALLALAGCTHAEESSAPVTATDPVVDGSAALDGYPGIDRGAELLDQRGRGSSSFPLPAAAAWSSVVFTTSCDDPDAGPWRLQLRTATGAGTGWIAAEQCGGASGEYPVDPADPVTGIEVQVPDGAGYTVLVYGLPD